MRDQSVFITWKPDYNLGIPVIDEQHRGIVSIINSLYYGMRNNYIQSMLAPIINMLHDYTHIHFQVEEDLLKGNGFPELESHHALHQELISKLAEVGRDSMLDKDPYRLMDFLKSWWINHICEKDMAYRDYLIKGGPDS